MTLKLLLPIFLFWAIMPLCGQNSDQDLSIRRLKYKIDHTENAEKLKLMDSLSNLVPKNDFYDYESLAKGTINYAIALDSLSIAAHQVSNLLDYYNNIKNQPEEGLSLFKGFLGKASMINDDQVLAKLYLNVGDSFYFTGDYEAALIYYQRVQYYAKRTGDQSLIALSKLYTGIAYSDTGSFAEGSIEMQRAVAIFRDLKDTFNIISAKNSLSELYSQNSFFKEAKVERDDAIALAKKQKSHSQLASFYYSAATDEDKMGHQDHRITYLDLALKNAQLSEGENNLEPTVLSALVVALSENDNIAQAEEYLNKLEVDSSQVKAASRPQYLEALKSLSFAKGNYEQALLLGEEHLELEKQRNSYEDIQDAEKFLSEVYAALGNSDESYKHFRNYYTIKDSILNSINVKALSYYQTLYETEKKDLTIKTQQNDIELLDAKDKVKNQLILFGGLGLFGLFAVIVLLRARSASRKREKLQQDFSQELIKAQEAERTRVARELHDSVGQKLMLLTKKTKSSGDQEMEFLAGDTLAELRSISRGLHPAALEKLGITAAVKSLINEVDNNTNIFFTNEIENIDAYISKEASLHLFRIIQEVLSNIVKHAQAKAAFITIKKRENTIEATIMDNGKGFLFSEKSIDGSSLGMKTLLERAKIIRSKLDIKSEINMGTTVALSIPMQYDA